MEIWVPRREIWRQPPPLELPDLWIPGLPKRPGIKLAISTRNVFSLNQSGLNTIILTKPSGVVSGDVMYASVMVANATTHATAPGWTEVAWKAETNNATTLTILRLVAGGSEPANYTFTGAAAQTISGSITALIGVDNTTPEDAAATVNSGNGVTLTAPTITTVTDGAWWLVYFNTNGNATTLSLPTGFTNDVVTFGSLGDMIRQDHKLIASHGATGTATSTQDDASGTDWWVTISLAIRPAGGVAPSPGFFSSAGKPGPRLF